MATLDISFPIGTETGPTLRGLARAIEQISADVPDSLSTGAATVLRFSGSPTHGSVSVQIVAGPYSVDSHGVASPEVSV